MECRLRSPFLNLVITVCPRSVSYSQPFFCAMNIRVWISYVVSLSTYDVVQCARTMICACKNSRGGVATLVRAAPSIAATTHPKWLAAQKAVENAPRHPPLGPQANHAQMMMHACKRSPIGAAATLVRKAPSIAARVAINLTWHAAQRAAGNVPGLGREPHSKTF